LENIVERAVIISPGKNLEVTGLNITVRKKAAKSSKVLTDEDFQRSHILSVLKRTNGKISGPKGAAQLLELNPQTLYSKMRKLGIKKGDLS
ncbi:MAG: helix-turn-helix domain-containing protein, partial [Cyclobacteriaceae bacterium]